MICNPKICIVFNSGSCGDFLTTLIYEQVTKTKLKLQMHQDGTVINPPGYQFKMACRYYFENRFTTNDFENIDDWAVVNTHHCYPEILNLFPNCKFYYIDDTDYIDVSVDTYIKKRASKHWNNLTEWLHNVHSYTQIHKIKNLTDEQIKQIMFMDWRKNVLSWKQLQLEPIRLNDVINKEKCKQIVENVVQCTIEQEIFDSTYDQWATKNQDLIQRILNNR
jgi:hypothetical protein